MKIQFQSICNFQKITFDFIHFFIIIESPNPDITNINSINQLLRLIYLYVSNRLHKCEFNLIPFLQLLSTPVNYTKLRSPFIFLDFFISQYHQLFSRLYIKHIHYWVLHVFYLKVVVLQEIKNIQFQTLFLKIKNIILLVHEHCFSEIGVGVLFKRFRFSLINNSPGVVVSKDGFLSYMVNKLDTLFIVGIITPLTYLFAISGVKGTE